MTLGALNDAEIRALSLDRITDHLESRGWSFVARYGGHGRIYRNVDGSEVVVPGREDTWDYAIVVREVLRALTDVGADDGTTVYQDIQHYRRDIVRLQATTGSSEQGTIAPSAASELIAGATKLWEEAASSVLDTPSERSAYWDDARFGQTESGSYVITMLSPPVYVGSQLALGHDESEPTAARKVTRALRDAIRSTRELVSAMRGDDENAIDRAIHDGMTWGIPEGLRRAVEPFDGVEWHIMETSPVPDKRPEPTVTAFEQADVVYLKATVDLIKERQWERPSDRSVHGYVLKCQRRENQDVGVVTVQSLMPDIKGVQTIHMSLGREPYSLALRLHDQKLRVDARGELRQTGKATWELEGAEIRESLSEQWDEDQRPVSG